MRILSTLLFTISAQFFGLRAQNEIASFYFNVGKSIPTDFSLQALAKFKTQVQGDVYFTFEISALYSYTDSTGSRAINDRLAHDRLNYVKNYLDLNDPNQEIKFVPATLERRTDVKNVLNWRRVDVYYTIVHYNVIEIAPEVPTQSIENPIEEAEEEVEESPRHEHAEIHDDIQQSIERNEPFILNINFIPGTFKMESGSSAVLNVLASYLFKNTQMQVIIRGHVCCENNKRASKKRAQAVVKRLVEMGVDKSRMKALGMSNTEPLVSPERTESDRKKNRRVDAQFISPSNQ
jgi:outer membrane protein OmpA-like peptidoglycan-associated protein